MYSDKFPGSKMFNADRSSEPRAFRSFEISLFSSGKTTLNLVETIVDLSNIIMGQKGGPEPDVPPMKDAHPIMGFVSQW